MRCKSLELGVQKSIIHDILKEKKFLTEEDPYWQAEMCGFFITLRISVVLYYVLMKQTFV